jgi:hypothetical protein
MVLLPYTSDDSERFRRVAEAFYACRNVVRDLLSALAMKPSDGSAAASDLEAFGLRTPAVPEHWRLVVMKTTQILLYGASEHLGALGALYTAEEVLLSPIVLARCVFEHAAHVSWILGTPSESSDDRLARAMLEEIFSAEDVKMNAGRRFGKNSAEHQARTAIFRTTKREAAALFAPPHSDGRRPMLNGQVLPTPEDIVLHANRRNTRALPDAEMQGTYGFLSNYVHPTQYAVTELWTTIEEEGRVVPKNQRDSEFHERLAQFVVAPFYNAIWSAADYYGWLAKWFEDFTVDLDRLLPGMLVPGPTPESFCRRP